MPRSQTPVVSCALASIAHRIVAFRRMQTVGFCLNAAEAILLTTTIHISGLNDAACLLARSSSILPLLGWHVEFTTDVLARRSSGGSGTVRTHPLGNNNQFHEITLNSKVSGLPWREQAMVRRTTWDRLPLGFPMSPRRLRRALLFDSDPVFLFGAARLYRAASSDRRERG